MDFVSSYIPPSTTKFTPKGNGNKFDELPVAHEQCSPEQMEMLRNGNYHEVREQRKNIEMQPSQVKFIAPLSEDGDSLQSIKLTPRDAQDTSKRNETIQAKKIAAVHPGETRKRTEEKGKDKMKIFGFKFLRPASRQ